LNFIKKYLPTVQGRVLLGFAFVGAVVNGLGVDVSRPFDVEKAGVIAAAAAAWLFAELAGVGTPRPHDLALFARITDQFTPRLNEFLRNQDFWYSFPRVQTNGIREIDSWEGSRHEFQDGALQKRWSPIREQIARFSSLIASKTAPDRLNLNNQTVHPSIGDREEPNEHTRSDIKTLNEASAKLIGDVDAFERFARGRLGL